MPFHSDCISTHEVDMSSIHVISLYVCSAKVSPNDQFGKNESRNRVHFFLVSGEIKSFAKKQPHHQPIQPRLCCTKKNSSRRRSVSAVKFSGRTLKWRSVCPSDGRPCIFLSKGSPFFPLLSVARAPFIFTSLSIFPL